MTTKTASTTASSSQVSRIAAPAALFLMGAAMVFLAGFSHPATIHDAAHDTRHALSFPCH